MNTNEFEKIVDETFVNCKKILINKGREYQSTNETGVNVHANFERGASNVGVEPESVLLIYLSKHWDSITTYVKDVQSGKSREEINSNLTEPITGRIDDAINYLLLLKGMTKIYKK